MIKFSGTNTEIICNFLQKKTELGIIFSREFRNGSPIANILVRAILLNGRSQKRKGEST